MSQPVVSEKKFSAAVAERRATPSFLSEPVPDEDLRKILEAGLHAPSGYNLQPWRFVVIRTPEQRARLREAAMRQPKVEEAPVVIVACGDTEPWRNLEEELRIAEQQGWGGEKEYASARKNVSRFFESGAGNSGG